MALHAITVDVHEGEHPAHDGVLDFYLEGAKFYEDKRHAYGFKRCDTWILIDIPRRERIRFRDIWKMPRRWLNSPDRRLVRLVSILVGNGLVTSRGATMQGYGGCFFYEDVMKIKRSPELYDLQETIREIIGILTRHFHVDEASVTVTTLRIPARA